MNQIKLITFIGVGNILASIINTYLIISYFGTTRNIEIFFASVTIIDTLQKLVQSGYISEIFTPIYHNIKNNISHKEAHDSFSSLLNAISVFCILLIFILYLIVDNLIELIIPGFTFNEKLEASNILIIILPLILFNTINGVLETFLNSEFSFGAPEIIKLSVQFTQIFILIFFVDVYGVNILIFLLWFNSIFRALLNLIKMKKIGFNYKFIFHTNHFSIFQISRSLGSTFFHVITAQSLVFTVTSLLSNLPVGSIAVYNYARKFEGIMNAITSRPSAIVFFSEFSNSVSLKSEKLTKTLQKSIKSNIAIAVFISSGVYINIDLFFNLFLPKINQTDFVNLLIFCKIFIFFVPIFCIGQIYRKTVVSFRFTTLYYIATSIVQILVSTLYYLFVGKYDFNGIFISTSIHIILFAACPIFILMIKNKIIHPFSNPFSDLLKLLLPVLLSLSSIHIINSITSLNPILNLFLINIVFIFIYLLPFSNMKKENGLYYFLSDYLK